MVAGDRRCPATSQDRFHRSSSWKLLGPVDRPRTRPGVAIHALVPRTLGWRGSGWSRAWVRHLHLCRRGDQLQDRARCWDVRIGSESMRVFSSWSRSCRPERSRHRLSQSWRWSAGPFGSRGGSRKRRRASSEQAGRSISQARLDGRQLFTRPRLTFSGPHGKEPPFSWHALELLGPPAHKLESRAHHEVLDRPGDEYLIGLRPIDDDPAGGYCVLYGDDSSGC